VATCSAGTGSTAIRWTAIYLERKFLKIRLAEERDQQDLIKLICDFRLSLAILRGKANKFGSDEAKKELLEYLNKHFPIYVAEKDTADLVGYIVCRLEGDLVWAESLYVASKYRRRGIGSSLYDEAEKLSHELGGNPPYNWIDPNNGPIIDFLRKRGYTVLNLIELRRAKPEERLTRKIIVGNHEFDHQ
jgi:ribosomal protein S18 acetylase RimI-like enzyme